MRCIATTERRLKEPCARHGVQRRAMPRPIGPRRTHLRDSTYLTGGIGARNYSSRTRVQSYILPRITAGAEATAFLARTSGLSTFYQNAYIALIDGLVADGVWAKFDFFHVYATADSTTALLNLVSSSFNGTAHGSPNFAVNSGFLGVDGSSTVYIDTGFNPSTASTPQYTRNSAHLSVYSASTANDINPSIGAATALSGNVASEYLIERYITGDFVVRVNVTGGAGTQLFAASANGAGHFVGNRPNSTTLEVYFNGAGAGSAGSNTSNALLNLNFYTLGANGNGTAGGCGKRYSAASAGASLSSTDVANYTARLQHFLDTIVGPQPGFVTDTDTFFAPTIAVGSVALTPGLVNNDDSFFAPTVVDTVTLTAAFVTDDDTFFAPTITAGSVTLTPSLFNDVDAFLAPTVTTGSVTMLPALVTDADAFFSPTVAAAQFDLTPGLATDSDVFYEPAVVVVGTLAPSRVSDADAFFAPTVVPGAVSLLPSIFNDTEAFFAPTIDARYSLLPTLVTDADAFFAPTVVPGAVTLLPSLVAPDDVIPPVVLSTRVLVQPDLLSFESVIYPPAASSPSTLLTPLVADADAFFVPTVTGGAVSIHPPLVIDQDIFLTALVGIQKKAGQGGGGTGGTVTTDLKYGSQITMTESGLVTALQADASTAKVINTRMMIYADNAGLPGALLGQSAVKTSVVVGSNIYPLLVPVSLLIGQKVWIALHSDGNFNWFLVASPSGAKYNTDLFSDGPSDPYGPVSNDNKKAPVFVLYLSAATAAMSASLVTDADAFYAPLIGGSKTLLPALLQDEDFFYSPSALSIDVESPSIVPDADAFYVPAVARSALLPDVVPSDDVVYSPFVGAHAPTVFGADMPSDNVIYEATVTSFGANLPPVLYEDPDAIYDPSVVVAYQVADDPYVDDDAFYDASVDAGLVTLLPEPVSSGEDFYDPVVTRLLGTAELLASLLVDDDVIYSPSRVGHKSGRRQVYLQGRNESGKTLETVEE